MSPTKMPTLRRGVNQQQQQRSTNSIKEAGKAPQYILPMEII